VKRRRRLVAESSVADRLSVLESRKEAASRRRVRKARRWIAEWVCDAGFVGPEALTNRDRKQNVSIRFMIWTPCLLEEEQKFVGAPHGL